MRPWVFVVLVLTMTLAISLGRSVGLNPVNASATAGAFTGFSYVAVLGIRDRHRLRHTCQVPTCGIEQPGLPRCTRLLVRGECLRHGPRP